MRKQPFKYPHGLLSKVADDLHYSRSTVWRVAHGKIKDGDPAIMATVTQLLQSGWTRHAERQRKRNQNVT